MMDFSVLILGAASASPTKDKHTTCQVVTHNNNFFLVDCGEAAQFQLRKYKISIQKINHIFISHLHGDHYLGLPGLIFTMHLLGRQAPLHIYCPPMLKDIIDINLKASGAYLRFPVEYHFTQDKKPELLFENEHLAISSFPLDHRIACTGFVFCEKEKLRKINKEAAGRAEVPVYFMNNLKLGEDFKKEDGAIIKNKDLTFDPPPSYSYAFCSDTAYNESIIPHIKNVDLLYHEATFLSDLQERSNETCHSTAKEAATIAQKAKVKKLLIGHFSNRYTNTDELLKEAKSIFKNTETAEEGRAFALSVYDL